MTNAWIEHVKNYRAQNPGMSYKTAMHEAGASYTPGTMQGAGMKDMMRKAKNSAKKARKTANRVSQEIDNNKNLINMVAPSAMKQIEQAQKIHAQIDNQAGQIMGGKFQLNRAVRKAKNTVKRVRDVARTAAPILSMVAPEIGIPLTTALAMSGGSLGSARGMNKYRSGGSFLVGGSFNTPGASYGGS